MLNKLNKSQSFIDVCKMNCFVRKVRWKMFVPMLPGRFWRCKHIQEKSVLWYLDTKLVIQVQRCYLREYGGQALGRLYQATVKTSAKVLPPGIWRTSTWKTVYQAAVRTSARDRYWSK
jgi:hypothetical protein